MNPVKILPLTLTFTALSLMCVPALAEKKDHGAHEHGVAQLSVATSSEGFEITLESPAANIFGFEHKPSSDEDKVTVEKAVATLKAGEALFVANAGECSLHEVDIDSALIDDEHDDHEKHEDDHDKHDDHKKHDDDHDKHDDHASESTHNDVEATWHFDCEKATEVESVEVKLFSAFPKGFEELDVDWITATKAGHVELVEDGVVTVK